MASAGDNLAWYGDESHPVFIMIGEGEFSSFMK